jgi:hypothetical protein
MPSHSLDFPQIVNLGIYRGACQCNCVHCPVGLTDKIERKKMYGASEMDIKVFRLFCDEVKNYKTSIRIHGVGEPTLHSKFTDILEIIRHFRLQYMFWIFTNGLFARHLIPELVQSLNIIEVSINSCNSEDYIKSKGTDGFQTVVENVNIMRNWIIKHGLSTRIILTRVQSSKSEDEKFMAFWSERGFECFVRSFHTYSGLLRQQTTHNQVSQDVPKCLVPWRRFNLDGTISNNILLSVNCFNVLFQEPSKIGSNCIMGQFPTISLMEIWNGSALKKLRHKLKTGLSTKTECDCCVECLTDSGPRAENLIIK